MKFEVVMLIGFVYAVFAGPIQSVLASIRAHRQQPRTAKRYRNAVKPCARKVMSK